jgi:hypothetical protein
LARLGDDVMQVKDIPGFDELSGAEDSASEK